MTVTATETSTRTNVYTQQVTDTMSVTQSVTETDFVTLTSIEEVPTTRTYVSTQVIDETKVRYTSLYVPKPYNFTDRRADAHCH